MDEKEILTRWFARVKADKWVRRHQFTEPEFSDHAKAIGQLLLSWNDLHERLASLFVFALGGGWVNRPLALWHAVRNDVAKRRMLRVAVNEVPDGDLGSRTKLKKEIEWILSLADKLEGVRDDAAHTPLYYYPAVEGDNPLAKIIASGILADTIMGNERALRINRERKNLVAEFEYARRRIVILRDYAMAIDWAWGYEQLPWPDRPKLPDPPPARLTALHARAQTRSPAVAGEPDRGTMGPAPMTEDERRPLAESADGTSDALLLGHGFTLDMTVGMEGVRQRRE
jgi:hypothetical protein